MQAHLSGEHHKSWQILCTGAIYLLWRQLGAAAFVAAGFLCLVFPINTLLTSMSSKLLKASGINRIPVRTIPCIALADLRNLASA
jgi:hypothetical protein